MVWVDINTTVQQLRGAHTTTFGSMGGLKWFLESLDYWLQQLPEFFAVGIDIAKLADLVKRCVKFDMQLLGGEIPKIHVWRFYPFVRRNWCSDHWRPPDLLKMTLE
jgi:phage terminase large subunit-like protein